MMRTSSSCIALVLLLCAAAAQSEESWTIKSFQKEADALQSFVSSDVGRCFVASAPSLPAVEPRMIFQDKATRQWHTPAEIEALRPKLAEAPREAAIDTRGFYHTKYGSPLAYSRAIDLVGNAGLKSLNGGKVLDFGYGSIGQLRMLATCGAHAVGVDVDTFLPALYREPSDQGPYKTGRVSMVHGRWPAEDAARAGVGGEYDLIISKNTLKRGYLHPPEGVEVNKNQLIDLGVDDDTFVRAMFDALKPGGYVMIYNLAPRQADLAAGEKYLPMADGRCAFNRDLLENIGFRVLAFDVNDSPAARTMAKALGWDQGERPMNLEMDLFGHYTLLQKP